jgi:DNA-binding protein HU-beta
MLLKQLIKEVAEKSGQSQARTSDVLDAAYEVIKAAVARGEGVMVFGLGQILRSSRGAKKARNMATGEACIVGPRNVALFRPSDSLNAALNP